MSKRKEALLPWMLREQGYAVEFSKWMHTSMLFYWWMTRVKEYPKEIAQMIIHHSEPRNCYLAVDLFAQLGFITIEDAQRLTNKFSKQQRRK